MTSVLIQPSLASRLGDLGGGQLLDTSSDAAKNLATLLRPARAMVLGSQGKKNGVAQIELEGLWRPSSPVGHAIAGSLPGALFPSALNAVSSLFPSHGWGPYDRVGDLRTFWAQQKPVDLGSSVCRLCCASSAVVL